MNIKKVEKQARKINQLLENIKEEGSVSNIEKDLLLSYIRDMYDKVLNLEENKNSNHRSSQSPYEQPAVAPQNTPEPIETISKPVNIADVVRREVAEQVPQEPVTPSSHEYAPSPVAPPVVDVIQEEEPASAPAELLALFSQDVVSELSDKLGRSPINDLTKSMGINEKIFTVKELFGGDSNLFSKTMQDLNNLTSLEQARDYLVSNVALEQDWTSESKIKKATNFIKLISRRY